MSAEQKQKHTGEEAMKGIVVFDLDGTLLCTHIHVCRAVHEVLALHSLPDVEDERIRMHIGEDSTTFLRAIAPGCRDFQLLKKDFRKVEREYLAKEGQLYKGVPEVLAQLRKEGFQLWICSSGSVEYSTMALKRGGIEKYFDEILSARDYESKSHALHIKLRLTPCRNVIVVGDRAGDLEAACKNDLPFVGARYGYGTENEKKHMLFAADTPFAVYSWVVRITLFAQIYEELRKRPVVKCIGINGIDTSGKSMFTDDFSIFLKYKGRKVSVIHLDDFHNPKALRLQGKDEVTAYFSNAFDTSSIINALLLPLKRFGRISAMLALLDLDTDLYINRKEYAIESDSLVLFEGVLLYRPPLEEFIDYKIFLDIGFDEMLRRAEARDVPRFGAEILAKYRQKYIPVQKKYLEMYKPREKSDLVIDNSDPLFPKVMKDMPGSKS